MEKALTFISREGALKQEKVATLIFFSEIIHQELISYLVWSTQK